MNIKRKINKNSGYTLIELIIFVGLLALLMMSVYVLYDRFSNRAKANSLSKQLIVLSQNIESSFATLLSPTGLTDTYALEARLVPPALANISDNEIVNTYGGNVELGVVGNNYTITLTDIPRDSCSYVATSNFFRLAPGVTINGTVIKTEGPINSTHLTQMAINCGTNLRSTLVATFPIIQPPLDVPGDLSPLRDKEDPRYIAKISAGEPSQACSGGAVWNNNFCTCPSGQQWNGSQCIVFGSVTPQAGWCQLGEGWIPNTKTCAPLPNTSPYGSGANNVYVNGRNQANIIDTNRVHSIPNVLPSPLPTINTEVIAGRSITSQAGILDNNTLQVCVNGTWNAAARSCETPAN